MGCACQQEPSYHSPTCCDSRPIVGWWRAKSCHGLANLIETAQYEHAVQGHHQKQPRPLSIYSANSRHWAISLPHIRGGRLENSTVSPFCTARIFLFILTRFERCTLRNRPWK